MLHALQETHGLQVIHAWGMTETSPVGTASLLKPRHAAMSKQERYKLQTKQGFALFGVDLKIVDDDGQRAAVGRHIRGRALRTRPLDRVPLFSRGTGRSGRRLVSDR